jgi:hypothetical protein
MSMPSGYEGVYEVLQTIMEPKELNPGQVARESQLMNCELFEKEGRIRLIGFVKRRELNSTAGFKAPFAFPV